MVIQLLRCHHFRGKVICHGADGTGPPLVKARFKGDGCPQLTNVGKLS